MTVIKIKLNTYVQLKFYHSYNTGVSHCSLNRKVSPTAAKFDIPTATMWKVINKKNELVNDGEKKTRICIHEINGSL